MMGDINLALAELRHAQLCIAEERKRRQSVNITLEGIDDDIRRAIEALEDVQTEAKEKLK